MVDEFERPRITDFGLAKVIDTQFSASSSRGLGTSPVKWLAPELLNPDRFGSLNARTSTQSDIYAFAMTIFEVCSCSLFKECFLIRRTNSHCVPGLYRSQSVSRSHRPCSSDWSGSV